MPGEMNGTELWEVCRAKAPGVPVILISGSPIELYLPFLKKPFSTEDFRSLYELLLTTHKRGAA